METLVPLTEFFDENSVLHFFNATIFCVRKKNLTNWTFSFCRFFDRNGWNSWLCKSRNSGNTSQVIQILRSWSLMGWKSARGERQLRKNPRGVLRLKMRQTLFKKMLQFLINNKLTESISTVKCRRMQLIDIVKNRWTSSNGCWHNSCRVKSVNKVGSFESKRWFAVWIHWIILFFLI